MSVISKNIRMGGALCLVLILLFVSTGYAGDYKRRLLLNNGLRDKSVSLKAQLDRINLRLINEAYRLQLKNLGWDCRPADDEIICDVTKPENLIKKKGEK